MFSPVNCCQKDIEIALVRTIVFCIHDLQIKSNTHRFVFISKIAISQSILGAWATNSLCNKCRNASANNKYERPALGGGQGTVTFKLYVLFDMHSTEK